MFAGEIHKEKRKTNVRIVKLRKEEKFCFGFLVSNVIKYNRNGTEKIKLWLYIFLHKD